MKYSRDEACAILGISPNASEKERKSAYKNLVKLYHPDTGKSADVEKYCRVVEAYESLFDVPVPSKKPRIVGKTSHSAPTRAEYEAYKKRYDKQKEARKEEFKRREAELSAKYRAEEEDAKRRQAKKAGRLADAVRQARALQVEGDEPSEEYKKAVDAINAVLMAEHIKNLIRENDESSPDVSSSGDVSDDLS